MRITADFLVDLDLQVGAERGPDGEPSRHDVLTYDLTEAIERFATGWDDLPELIPGRPGYRLVITTGRLVSRISVIGQIAPDGAIELVSIDLDLHAGW